MRIIFLVKGRDFETSFKKFWRKSATMLWWGKTMAAG